MGMISLALSTCLLGSIRAANPLPTTLALTAPSLSFSQAADERNAASTSDVSVAASYGHSARVRYMVFSQDGRFLATGSTDQAACVWDTRSGREVQKFRRKDLMSLFEAANTLDEDERDLLSVALNGAMPIGFLADGRSLVTAHYDKKLKVWDIVTGKDLATIECLPPGLRADTTRRQGPLTLDIPEEYLENRDAIAGILAINSVMPFLGDLLPFVQGERRVLPPLEKTLLFAAPKKMDFILVGTKRGIERVELPAGAVSSTYVARGKPGTGLIRRLAVTGDGTVAAVALISGRIESIDTTTGKAIASERIFKEDILSLTISEDGSTMAAASEKGIVKILDMPSLKERYRLDALVGASERNLPKIVLNRDGSRALISESGTLPETSRVGKNPNQLESSRINTVIDTTSGAIVARVSGIDLSDGVFSEDGTRFLRNDVVLELKYADRTPPVTVLQDGLGSDVPLMSTTQLSKINSIAASPDNRMLAYIEEGGNAVLADRSSGIALFKLSGLGSPATGVLANRDDQLLVTAKAIPLDDLFASAAAEADFGSLPLPDGDFDDLFSLLQGKLPKIDKVRFWDSATRFVPPVKSRSDNGSLGDFYAQMNAPLWVVDTKEGIRSKVLQGHMGNVQLAQLTGADSLVSVGALEGLGTFFGGGAISWDLKSGQYQQSIGDWNRIVCGISPDGKYLTYIYTKLNKSKEPVFDRFEVQDSKGNVVGKITKQKDVGLRSLFTQDGKQILFFSRKVVRVFDIASGKFLSGDNSHRIEATMSDVTGRYALCVGRTKNASMKVYDFVTRKYITQIMFRPIVTQSFAVSPDGTQVAVGYDENKISVYDVATAKETHKLEGHLGRVTGLAFRERGDIVSTSEDCTVRLWDLATKKVKVTFVCLGLQDWVAITPENYYMSSRGANFGLSFRFDGQSYPFEQFDLRFNRPDKVVEYLNPDNKDLINALRLAYEKRLVRAGVKESDFSPSLARPTVEITNRSSIPYVTGERSVSLDAKITLPQGRTIDRLEVYVNDVMVSQAGDFKALVGKASHQGALSKVALSSGGNKIQLRVWDSSGASSWYDTVFVTCNAPAKRRLFVATVGVSDYKDSTMNLKYADDDARAIEAAFKQSGTLYDEVVTVGMLTDATATKANVLALNAKLKETTADDTVVLFFAGHGVLDRTSKDFYFATHDMDFNAPSKLGLSMEALIGLFNGVSARQRIMFLDACHSGELDDTQAIDLLSKPVGEGVRSSSVRKPRVAIGLNNSFQYMQQMFSDLNRGVGAHIIAAAAGLEYAYEKDGQGTFTKAVLEALNNPRTATRPRDMGQLRVSSLRDYVYRRVSSLTGGAQVPTSRQENLTLDFRLR